MTIKIRPSEQTLLNTIAAEAHSVNGSGLQLQPSTPISTTVYPIPEYANSVPAASSNETKVLEGMVGHFAPLIRQIGPIFGQATNNNPTTTISQTAVTLLSYSMPESLEVARTVEVSAQGSWLATLTNRILEYWVEVNGTPTTHFKFGFNLASTHTPFAGSWIVSLSPGANTITLRAVVTTSTGSVTQDTNDFTNITIRG
jgi:hypothetical protein